MQLVKPDININFIGSRKIAYLLSAAMIVVSLTSLIIHNGPKYGIDFSGGTLIQVRFNSDVQISDIKSGLATSNIDSSGVQTFGEEGSNEYLIRTDRISETSEGFIGGLRKALDRATGSETEVRRVEMVGPQVGKDLREKALFAMFYALLFIAIYISGRFELKWMISGIMAAALSSASSLPRGRPCVITAIRLLSGDQVGVGTQIKS